MAKQPLRNLDTLLDDPYEGLEKTEVKNDDVTIGDPVDEVDDTDDNDDAEEDPKEEVKAEDAVEEPEEEEGAEEEGDAEEEEDEEEDPVDLKDEVEEPKKEENKDSDDAAEKGDNADQIISDRLKKVGLESFDQLDEFVKEYEEVLQENEELQNRPTEPQFKTDKQKKLYEFINEHDFNEIQDGLISFAKLSQLDIANLDEKTALQELFVLNNPDTPREDAIQLFEYEYGDRYEYKMPEDEDEVVDEKKKHILGIKKKTDAAKARKSLLEAQNKWKSTEKEEAKQEEDPRDYEAISEAQDKHISDLKRDIKPFDTITFSVDENKDNDFHFKLSDKQKQEVLNQAENFLMQPELYDDEGKMTIDYDAEHYIEQFVYLLHGKKAVEEALKHNSNVNIAKQVELKSKAKPTREAKTGGQKAGSIEGQLEMLAKQKAKERAEKETSYSFD